jgi:hypothetical protein
VYNCTIDSDRERESFLAQNPFNREAVPTLARLLETTPVGRLQFRLQLLIQHLRNYTRYFDAVSYICKPKTRSGDKGPT